ncbi:MAG: hypothetical protein IT368_12990 [Candidatus Hydrogenedentes bacterium]|nr:hypothetical protein [Candidatus Hydrogenedentota bacterium]
MFRMVQNRHIAEELTQEVFLALVRNAGRYEPTAKFTTYLYTIASNIVSKEWARQKRRPKHVLARQDRECSRSVHAPIEKRGSEPRHNEVSHRREQARPLTTTIG